MTKRLNSTNLKFAIVTGLILSIVTAFGEDGRAQVLLSQGHAQEDAGIALESAKLESFAVVGGKLAKTVEDAALETKLDLSPEAKDLVVKDLLREKKIQDMYLNKTTMSPAEVREIIEILARGPKGRKLTLQDVETKLAAWRADTSVSMLPDQIATNAAQAGITLTKQSATFSLMYADLVSRTKWMAKSHLSVEEIYRKNNAYLTAVFAATRDRILDEGNYRRARQAMFQKIVRVTIKSIPNSAEVEVNGTHVGRTVIEKKPIEAGQEYVFLFRLDGYKTDRRMFYVLPDQPTQEVLGLLLPAK